jgi:hypothetical protein
MEKVWKGYKGASKGSNIPVRTLRTLVKNGVLPHIRAGHRTIFFVPSKVEKALRKREVREA